MYSGIKSANNNNIKKKNNKNKNTLIMIFVIVIIAFTPLLISKLIPTGNKDTNHATNGKNNIGKQTGETFDYKENAVKFVEYLLEGDYEKAVEKFDDTMAKALNEHSLKDAWEQVTTTAGKYIRQVEVRERKQDSFYIVEVVSEFENTGIITRVVFNEKGEISGLWFNYTSIQDKSNEKGRAGNGEDGSQLGEFSEENVNIGEGEWVLPGVLTLPVGEGPFPAVVLVHGSGPHDKDETIGPNKPFKDLADGLAQRGIAVLRYDKRTLVHASKIQNIANITVKEETIDDAISAVELLKKDERIARDKIFILGHSLGGMLAPRIAHEIASTNEKDGIAGIIIMAGSPRRLEDIIFSQLKYFLDMDTTKSDNQKEEELRKYEEEIIRIKELDSLEYGDIKEDLYYFGIPAYYWKDLNSYDTAELAAKIDIPILILQGEKDFQVFTEDYELWKEKLSTKKNVTFKLYPELNHIFMEHHNKGTIEDYYIPGHIPQYVIDDINSWIESNS
ncbi:MAG TPA: alpha/beta fold hydrolase [Clostridiaceae bacterium]|nr:alpha/beta fold hydrolase [Clostridiaceae bacterium]